MSPDACPADTPTGIPWFVARKKKRKKEKEGETFYESNEKVLSSSSFSLSQSDDDRAITRLIRFAK